MERIWAPWRTQYIKGIDAKKEDGCIFCTKPAQSTDRENLILYRGHHAYIIMNRYPYTNGHLMVVPYRHTASMAELDDGCVAEMWRLAQRGTEVLGAQFRAEGFNVGINLGRIAGAGIADHLHLHVVPRWSGDTNFMPVLSEVRIISQDLWSAFDQLKLSFATSSAS
jgi:ATP adenylyltransferase